MKQPSFYDLTVHGDTEFGTHALYKKVSIFNSHLVVSSFDCNFHKFLLSLQASIVGILK